MIIPLKFLAVIALVLLNGFFVASEFAIVRVRDTRLKILADAGNFRARVARSLVGNLDGYISAIQLGITMINLALGWLGEPMVSSQIRPALLALGVESAAVAASISFALAFALVTYFTIVLGELVPKSMAIRRTEPLALWVAIPLRVFYAVFYPAIWLLNTSASRVLRLLGIEPAAEAELALSETELLMILGQSARGGLITEQEWKISERALRFARFTARMILVPRNEIVYFSLADSMETNLAKARRDNYARYPLCERDLDSVIGMIHIRDLLWMLREGKSDLRAISRGMTLVSEDETLDNLLERFRSTHRHMALIVDETGSVSGLVTMEDVLEQLVGQIQDEFDRESPLMHRVQDDPCVYELAGSAPLTLIKLRIGLDFGGADAVTVSGYFTERLGRFPEHGDALELSGWRLTAVAIEGIKVKTCRLERKEGCAESAL